MATRVFQSSPDPKVGCHSPKVSGHWFGLLVSILTRPEGRVPHFSSIAILEFFLVSILTRPEGRVPPEGEDDELGIPLVSILTRPEGRVPHNM